MAQHTVHPIGIALDPGMQLVAGCVQQLGTVRLIRLPPSHLFHDRRWRAVSGGKAPYRPLDVNRAPDGQLVHAPVVGSTIL